MDKYGLRKKITTYVKDEGFNFNVMIIALKSIASCESLSLEKSLQGICFGHAFSKACQYDIAQEKVYENIKYVPIEFIQTNLQKCMT